MPSVNPGPASTSTQSSLAGLVPVNSQGNSGPLLANALRLIASYRGVNCAQAGDYPMIVNNTTRFVPSLAYVAVNSATTVAASAAFLSAASVGIYPAAAGAGTAIATAAAGSTLGASLTSVTTITVSTTNAVTATTVYYRVGTAATTAAYFDVFLYGYDIS